MRIEQARRITWKGGNIINIKEMEKHLKNEVNIQVRRQEAIQGKFEPWYKNNQLSMQAKGIMNHLWDQIKWTNNINIKFIAGMFSNSEHEVKCAINELIRHGYIFAYQTEEKRVRFDLFRSKFRAKNKKYVEDLL